MKPKDNQENIKKCVCGICPLYIDCNKSKMEALFCARKKSECALDSSKMCICGSCPVYGENKLAGGYFCIKEIGIK
jgi:hypothetical protein